MLAATTRMLLIDPEAADTLTIDERIVCFGSKCDLVAPSRHDCSCSRSRLELKPQEGLDLPRSDYGRGSAY
jgi:hypothetical protein